MVRKYVLTLLLTLLTYNAYAFFDFENYVPTLTNLYNQGQSAGTSAYTMSFTQVAINDGNNVITTYAVDDETPKYYRYLYDINGTSSGSYVSNGTNEVINNITNNFIDFTTSNTIYAILNYGTINSTTGDFIYNHGAFGNTGLITNGPGGKMNYITGDFINNVGPVIRNGGVYYNNYVSTEDYSHIGTIRGNFIGNVSYGFGGAIWNNDAIIDHIIGNFIGNKLDSSVFSGVGAIYNDGIIGDIVGDFIDNIQGAIMNLGSINSITGDFIGNSGGAIAGAGSINYITGDFISNSGDVIINNQNNMNITGNIVNNVATGNNGVVHNSYKYVYSQEEGGYFKGAVINFISNSENYVISDNYSFNNNGRKDLAIYSGITEFPPSYDANVTDFVISFTNNNSTHYTVNDEIDGVTHSVLNIGGDNTGYTTFNNNIDSIDTVNINNGKMFFGQTPSDYTGTPDIGRFVKAVKTIYKFNEDMNIWLPDAVIEVGPIMNMNNGTFDIANGYTETVGLKSINSIGNNNFLLIDLDTENKLADVIEVDTDITGQINLVVNSLSNLDIDNYVIWFSEGVSDENNPFNLYSVSGLDYDLQVYVDESSHRYGLIKQGVTNPEDPNSGNASPNEPEQPVALILSAEVIQMADYTAKTVTHTVQKLTNSMQKRVGELQWLLKDNDNQSDLNNAFWTRGIHKNFDADNTSVGLSGIEFGYDRMILSTDNYKWFIGGLGYMSMGDSKFKDTKLDISGYGLGAYLMMLEQSGWFTDFVFRQHFINMKPSDVKTDYTASSLSLEIGKEFVFGCDELKWFTKPSLEGTYISISGTDIGSFKVQDSTSSMASLSVLAGPRWDFASGGKFQAYGKIGYTLDNSDKIDVVVNGVSTKQTVATNTTEFGIGFDYRGIEKATNIYLEASYITGTNYSELSGNLGLRYVF